MWMPNSTFKAYICVSYGIKSDQMLKSKTFWYFSYTLQSNLFANACIPLSYNKALLTLSSYCSLLIWIHARWAMSPLNSVGIHIIFWMGLISTTNLEDVQCSVVWA